MIEKNSPTAKGFRVLDEIIVLKDNQTALEEFSVDPDSYFVIVTRGHLHDQVILTQVLNIDAVYIRYDRE